MTWKRMLAPREVPRALRSRRAGRAGSSHRARRCAGSRTLASGRVLRMRALHGDAVRMRAVSGRASDASPGSTALLCVFPRERSFPRGFSKKSLPQIYARRHSTTRKLTSPALRLAFGSGQSARRPERLLALGSPPDWGQQPRLLPWPRNSVRSTERRDAAGPEACPASDSHEAARALDQRALWGPSPRTRRA